MGLRTIFYSLLKTATVLSGGKGGPLDLEDWGKLMSLLGLTLKPGEELFLNSKKEACSIQRIEKRGKQRGGGISMRCFRSSMFYGVNLLCVRGGEEREIARKRREPNAFQ